MVLIGFHSQCFCHLSVVCLFAQHGGEMRMFQMALAWSTQCPRGIILDTAKQKWTEIKHRKQRQRDLQQNYILLLFSFSVFSICLQTWQYRWDGSEREVIITLELQSFDVSEAQSLMGLFPTHMNDLMLSVIMFLFFSRPVSIKYKSVVIKL